jgi:hypothetical protein
MYGLSQHVQLEEHGTACDMPPHGLIGYDLRLEKSLLQVILQIQCRRLDILLIKKFMDLVVSSPRIAEMIKSIWNSNLGTSSRR